MKESWEIKDYDEIAVLKYSKECDISKELAIILYDKGYRSNEEILNYLYPQIHFLYNPYLLKDLDKALIRIKSAITCNEKIGVFADSDLDGMTSLALLKGLFNKFGINIYYRYIKNEETYGLTHTIIDEFKKQNVKLIITADSGIRDFDEIEYAKSSNIDVIITDHHEPDERIPDAIIINPKQKECNYPFKELAGVGVVFKLCHGLLLSYLPSYNKPFILITKNGIDYHACVIINFLTVMSVADGTLLKIYEKLSVYTKDCVILCDKSITIEELSELFKNKLNIYYFNDFITKVIDSEISSADSTVNHVKSIYNKINDTLSIEDMSRLLFEIHHYASIKLNNFIKEALVYVAIGTIADVMPIVDENRVMVKHGLLNFSMINHTGLMMFAEKGTATSKTISWNAAPLLNSPGRFGKTELTEKFLLLEDSNEIEKIYNEIKALNEQRKKIVKESIDKALIKLIEEPQTRYSNIDCVVLEGIPEGIAGLIAQRLSESTDKPTIVLVPVEGSQIYKGSGRFNGDFDFFSHVVPYVDMFVRVGGHPQAFGFTIEGALIKDLMFKIDKSLNDVSNYQNKITKIDVSIDIKSINERLVSDIMLLEPFGKNNIEPVFLSECVDIEEFAIFGAENNHGRYRFKHAKELSAIGWNMSEKMQSAFIKKSPIDLVYHIEKNIYKNNVYIQLILLDFDVSNPR